MASTTHDRPVAAARMPPNVGEPGAHERLLVGCLASQPWRIDLPTNRQQVMARVSESGHRVLYVETGPFVGKQIIQLLRGPDRRSLLRQLVATEAVAPGLRVMKAPTLAPVGSTTVSRWIIASLSLIRWTSSRAAGSPQAQPIRPISAIE